MKTQEPRTLQIIAEVEAGEDKYVVAERYNVDPWWVRDLIRRKEWKAAAPGLEGLKVHGPRPGQKQQPERKDGFEALWHRFIDKSQRPKRVVKAPLGRVTTRKKSAADARAPASLTARYASAAKVLAAIPTSPRSLRPGDPTSVIYRRPS